MWHSSNFLCHVNDLSLNYFVLQNCLKADNHKHLIFQMFKSFAHIEVLESYYIPAHFQFPRLTKLLSHADSWMGLMLWMSPSRFFIYFWTKFSSYFFLIFFGKIKLNEKNPLSAAATGILSSLLHLPEIFHQAGNAVKYDTYMTAACNCGSNILYIFSVYLLKY